MGHAVVIPNIFQSLFDETFRGELNQIRAKTADLAGVVVDICSLSVEVGPKKRNNDR